MTRPKHTTEFDLSADAWQAITAAGGEILLGARSVRQLIGNVSSATLYRMLADDQFPKPIAVTPGRKAWPMTVVQAWIRQRIADSAAPPLATGRTDGARQ